MFDKKQRGQVLLIVVLVIIVASTIGLSVATRSITSLRTSTEEAESQKALAAAEAGIERAVQGLIPTNLSTTNLLNNSEYSTKVEEINGAAFLMNGGNEIPKNEGVDLWLSNYDPNLTTRFTSSWPGASLTFYWGDSATPCENSALEIIIVSGSKASPVSKRYVYDPCTSSVPSRQGENGFSSPDIGGGGIVDNKTFFHKATIGVSSALIARIIPIYKNTSVGVVGNVALPTQGYKVSATGISGQANRKIFTFDGYPQTYLPYLSYGLFVAINK